MRFIVTKKSIPRATETERSDLSLCHTVSKVFRSLFWCIFLWRRALLSIKRRAKVAGRQHKLGNAPERHICSMRIGKVSAKKFIFMSMGNSSRCFCCQTAMQSLRCFRMIDRHCQRQRDVGIVQRNFAALTLMHSDAYYCTHILIGLCV